MAKRKTHQNEIAAYVGIMPGGGFAWATVRPSREECAAMCERFQPSLPDHPSYLRIMPLWIGYDLNRQLTFQLGNDQPGPSDPDMSAPGHRKAQEGL